MHYQVKKRKVKRLGPAFNSRGGRMLSNRAAAFSVDALLSKDEEEQEFHDDEQLLNGQHVPSLQDRHSKDQLEQQYSVQEFESTNEIGQRNSNIVIEENLSSYKGKKSTKTQNFVVIKPKPETNQWMQPEDASIETIMEEDEDVEIDVVFTEENCPIAPKITKDLQTSESTSSNSSQVIRPQPIQATPHPLRVALHSVPLHPYHVHNSGYFLHPSAYPIHLPHHPLPFPIQVSPHIMQTTSQSVLNLQRQIHQIASSSQNQPSSPKDSTSSSCNPIENKEGSESPQQIIQSHNSIIGWSPLSPSHPSEPPWVTERLSQARNDTHLDTTAIECVTVEDCEPTECIGVVECGGGVTVQLLQQDLWSKFHRMGTEMIITKNGRRMFPVVKVRLQGLKPTSQYMVYLTMRPLDNRRYRYVYPSSRWMVAGSGEPNEDQQMPYVHPDSPATGEQWMAAPAVAFDRLKLTNNKARARDTKGQICLHSMQKYRPEVWVQEVGVSGSGAAWPELLGTLDTTVAHRASFPQTTFITVTAYQNQQITRLKIDSNPFAKGFRDSNKIKDGLERRQTTSKSRGVEDLHSGPSPGPAGVPPHSVHYLSPHLPQAYPFLPGVAAFPHTSAGAMALTPQILGHHLLPPSPGAVDMAQAHHGPTLGLPPPWSYAHHAYFRYPCAAGPPPFVVMPPGVGPHPQAILSPTVLAPPPSPPPSRTCSSFLEPGTSATTTDSSVLDLTKHGGADKDEAQAGLGALMPHEKPHNT